MRRPEISFLCVIAILAAFPLMMGQGCFTLPGIDLRPNTAPRADAGAPQQVMVGQVVHLNGLNSSDPDGDTLTYLWTQSQGPQTVALVNANSGVAAFVAPAAGTYIFTLTVNDGKASDEDTVKVEVVNQLPSNKVRLDVEIVGQGAVVPASGLYALNSTITLKATAFDGWRFARWEGDLSETSTQVQVFMDRSKSVRAIFVRADQINYTLSVTIQGQGTVQPAGGVYASGASVQLTAAPADGWEFDRWQGNLTGSANPTTITMNANKSVTAVFVEIVPPEPDQYILTTSTQGQGTVALNPSGGVYDEGTQVTLTATPAAGWIFDRWQGALTGSANPATITMDFDKFVEAVFVLLVPEIVAAPTFSPPDGATILDSGLVVTIYCSTQGADIRYTTDSSTPTRTHGSIIGSGSSIVLMDTATVKAMAYMDGMADSPVRQATYTKQPPDDSPWTIRSAETVTGHLSVAGQTDAWKFSGQAGGTVVIQMARISGNLWCHFDLYPPSGGIIETSASGISSALLHQYRLAESGQYTILIRAGTGTGEYGLSLLLIPGAATSLQDPDGGEISSGQTLAGTLSPPADTDAFTFLGQAGDTAVIQMARVSGNLWCHFDLYPPGGGEIEISASGISSALLHQHRLAHSGRYTIVIRAGTGTGGYNLSLTLIR